LCESKTLDHTEEELKQIELEKEELHHEIVLLKKKEDEIRYLFQENEAFFKQMFETWKKGETRIHLHHTYSEMKSAEKQVIHSLDEERESLTVKKYELDRRDDAVRHERLKIVRGKG